MTDARIIITKPATGNLIVYSTTISSAGTYRTLGRDVLTALIDVVPGKEYTITIRASSSSATLSLSVAGVQIRRGYEYSGSFKTFRFNYNDVFPATVTTTPSGEGGISKTPRYSIRSPIENGYYTQSVRELTPGQISSMKRRGFKVEQVSGGTALSPAISIAEGIISPRLTHRRLARSGFVGSNYNLPIQTVKQNVIPKSTYSPRTVFSENMFSYTAGFVRGSPPNVSGLQSYYVYGQNRVIRLTRSSAYALSRRGTQLEYYPDSRINHSTPRGSTSVNLTPLNDSFYSRAGRLSTIVPTIKKDESDYQVRVQNYDTLLAEQKKINNILADIQNQILRTTDNTLIQELQQQLTSLKNETNKQLGSINLQSAQSTEAAIKSLEAFVAESIKKINEAGQVAGDNLGQFKKDVDTNLGIFGGGISDFFGQPSNIILIIIVVMMMVMLKK